MANLKKILNKVFLRIPKPTLPPLHIVPMVLGDSVAIAIVSFAINVSMAKLFAKKHKYEIRPNQVRILNIELSKL